MANDKCSRCHRRGTCSLRNLADLTLPWVEDALQSQGSDWDRAHAVHRALRGVGGSPGFVEDWLFEGALTKADVTELIDLIIEHNEVDLAILVRSCRHYVGPSIPEPERLAYAANF